MEKVIEISTNLFSLGAVTTSSEDFQAEPWGWFVPGIRYVQSKGLGVSL